MTGSPVRRLFIPLLASVVLVGWPLAAAAQGTGGPIRLSPPRPLVTTPQPTAPAEEAPAVAPQQLPNVPGVSVQGLDRVEGEAVGTLGPRQGGLGADLWAGADRALVERLLPQLPAQSQSRAVRDLTRRLLLTAATPPAGQGQQNFVALRAERLLAMGDTDAAAQLIGNTPPRQRDDALLTVGVQADLLRYDLNNVCAEVDNNPSVLSVFWQQATILCRVLEGDESGATLGLDLLREQGVNDPLYFGLIDTLITQAEAGEVAGGAATPLNLALLRAARAQIPATMLSGSSPAVLRAIALSPNAADEIRLQAGLAAHRVGALDDGAVRELLAAHVEAGDSELAAIAELILAAARETVPTAKAAALQRGLAAAEEAGVFPIFARLAGAAFEDLSPNADIAWAGPLAIRALLLSNNADAAVAWYRVVRSEGRFDPELAAAATDLWPLLRLAHAGRVPTALPEAAAPDDSTAARDTGRSISEASIAALGAADASSAGRTAVIEQLVTPAAAPATGPDNFPYDNRDLEAWLAGDSAAEPLALALLDAFGDPLPPTVWRSVAGADDTRQPVDATLWLTLQQAADSGARGETLLLALVMLGDGDLGQVSPLALHGAIDALQKVGLLAEARHLAVEAALAAGA